MLQLEQEHFVQIYPRKGIIVSAITLDLLYEIYSIRKCNEPYIAICAAKVVDGEWCRQMRRDILHTPTDLGAARLIQYCLDVDHRFHSDMLRLCPNRFIQGMLSVAYDHMQRIRRLIFDLDVYNNKSNREHLAIIDALEDGDGRRITRAVHSHLSKFQDYSSTFVMGMKRNRHTGTFTGEMQ